MLNKITSGIPLVVAWLINSALLCFIIQTGCTSERLERSGLSNGEIQFIEIDGAYELWCMGCNLSENDKNKDAFVIYQMLIRLYPDSEWAIKARGKLTDKKYIKFCLEDAPFAKKSQYVSKKGKDITVDCAEWRGLKDKKEVKERFGVPDEVIILSPSDKEEKWIYKLAHIEFTFRQDRVFLVDKKNQDGDTIGGSVIFKADHPIE